MKGNVADISGGLPGVSIILKGTMIGAETDFDGNFTFKTNKKKYTKRLRNLQLKKAKTRVEKLK